MMTKRLFKENVSLREADAVVLRSGIKNGRTAVLLDRTVFFPEGGGQSADHGIAVITDPSGNPAERLPVIDCFEANDEIWHVLETSEEIPEGTQLHLLLDWDRRFDNMQRHCGEHILTGIFYREYGVTNRGFHMGDDYMTIDLAIEEDASVEHLDWEMCLNAELLANEIICQDLPMITRHFDTYEEAKNEPMRKKLTVEKDITLVGIGSPEYDWGCVACCGTHPSTTGQVGLVKIFKIEPNKGMYRIYFEAGRRAFVKYQREMETLLALGRKLSAGPADLLEKYDAQVEKSKEKSLQLALLKKEVLRREKEAILHSVSAGIPASDGQNGIDDAGHYVGKYSILSLDDLSNLARTIAPSIKKPAFLVCEPAASVLLVSDGSIDCGRLVKENAGIYQGKGGGNATLARAIFPKSEVIETFIDLIEKHLR